MGNNFYKHFTMPCSVIISQIQRVARKYGCILMAVNDADVNDLCEEENNYIGPESQELLFFVPVVLGNETADRTLATIKNELTALGEVQ